MLGLHLALRVGIVLRQQNSKPLESPERDAYMPYAQTVRRVSAEVALIVASVLLAFWIEASWSGLQEARLEADLIAGVAAEARTNADQLREIIRDTHYRLDLIDRFVAATPDELLGVEPPDAVELVTALPRVPEFHPLGAATQLLSEVPILDRSGVAVRSTVNEWLRQLEGVERNLSDLQSYRIEIQRRLTEYQDDPGLGTRRVPDAVAGSGLDIVSRLRADEELVQMVLHKRHIQHLYARDLEVLLQPLLDSIAAVTSQPGGGAL